MGDGVSRTPNMGRGLDWNNCPDLVVFRGNEGIDTLYIIHSRVNCHGGHCETLDEVLDRHGIQLTKLTERVSIGRVER